MNFFFFKTQWLSSSLFYWQRCLAHYCSSSANCCVAQECAKTYHSGSWQVGDKRHRISALQGH